MTITFHPRMPRVPLLLAAVLAVSVVALAAASGAQAAKPKPPKTATFKATLSGSQVTTWEYHDPKNPDDAR